MIEKECKVRVDGIDIYGLDSSEPTNGMTIKEFDVYYDSPQKDMLIEMFIKKEPFEITVKNTEHDIYIKQYCIIKGIYNHEDCMSVVIEPYT